MAAKKNTGGMSPLLQDLQSDLLKGCIEDEILFAGRKFRVHTLSDGELIWSYSYVTMASNMAMLTSRKSATLAAAISHVDGQPISALFDLPEDEKLKAFLLNDSDELTSYYREKMYAFLSPLPDRVITELYLFYESLDARREEVIKGLKAPSKETSSSGSSNTSSPGAGLPAAVQTVTAGSSFDG